MAIFLAAVAGAGCLDVLVSFELQPKVFDPAVFHYEGIGCLGRGAKDLEIGELLGQAVIDGVLYPLNL